MSYVNPKKKKERTPQQKVRRGRIALAILAAMALFILVFRPSKTEMDSATAVEKAMDGKLDSLLNIFAEGSTAYFRGEIEDMSLDVRIPQEDQLDSVNVYIKYIDNAGIPAGEKQKLLNGALQSKEYLEKQISRIKAMPQSKIYFKTRRIRFTTPDGKNYTCFQRLAGDRSTLKYIKDITNESTAEEELDKLRTKYEKSNIE